MKSLLHKLHEKLGDFWWYSLMIFIACRVGDAMNVFVGLWLVPKYVDASELGAVMPLTQFASCLALPVSVFAMVFSKEVTTLSVLRNFGQLKTLVRGVYLAAAIALVLAIIACRIFMPLFLERIRIVEGSLGILILASAFLSCSAPLYTNALQGLKKFKALSLLNILGAPVRLITMYLTMPFRALAGYFVGQGSTPLLQIVTSVFCLRRELAVPAESYWTRPVIRRFSRLMIGTAGYLAASSLVSLVEQMVIRQRLPDVESAAYYMTTRLSEISAFVTGTLMLTLFPFTAERAESGQATYPLVLKASLITIFFGTGLAAFFAFFGKTILVLLPNGREYAAYAWTIPWLIGITSFGSVWGYHANTEISANRFGFLKWWIPSSLLYVAGLLFITGYGYLTAYLPPAATRFLAAHNVTSLSAFLWWSTGITAVRVGCSSFDLWRQGTKAGHQ